MTQEQAKISITPEMINRCSVAVEGECDGLAIDDRQARVILEHALYGAPFEPIAAGGCAPPIIAAPSAPPVMAGAVTDEMVKKLAREAVGWVGTEFDKVVADLSSGNGSSFQLERWAFACAGVRTALTAALSVSPGRIEELTRERDEALESLVEAEIRAAKTFASSRRMSALAAGRMAMEIDKEMAGAVGDAVLDDLHNRRGVLEMVDDDVMEEIRLSVGRYALVAAVPLILRKACDPATQLTPSPTPPAGTQCIAEMQESNGGSAATCGWPSCGCPTPSQTDAPASDTRGLAVEIREKAMEAVAAALSGALDCTRVWDAWSYGTMTADDFEVVAEDVGRLAEIVDAAFSALPTAPDTDRKLADERERLALAICGGEDAPGHANARTVETLERIAAQNYADFRERAESADRKLARAADEERERCAKIAESDCDWAQFGIEKAARNGEYLESDPTERAVTVYRAGIQAGQMIAIAIRTEPRQGASRPCDAYGGCPDRSTFAGCDLTTAPAEAETAPDFKPIVEALQGLFDITEDSDGVTGYHKNGAIAAWGEFPEVEAAKNVLDAINKSKGE